VQAFLLKKCSVGIFAWRQASNADEVSLYPLLVKALAAFPFAKGPLLTSPFRKGGLRGILISNNVASPFTGDEGFLPPL
jgi:hypothetical protein